jgi:hypothetical protein
VALEALLQAVLLKLELHDHLLEGSDLVEQGWYCIGHGISLRAIFGCGWQRRAFVGLHLLNLLLQSADDGGGLLVELRQHLHFLPTLLQLSRLGCQCSPQHFVLLLDGVTLVDDGLDVGDLLLHVGLQLGDLFRLRPQLYLNAGLVGVQVFELRDQLRGGLGLKDA